MEHCEWAGFHFYDLIFPLFVFLVGVSIPFSIPKMIENRGLAATIRRIIFRSVILFLLGVFYMGGVGAGFKNVYLAGVLHRIAVAYFFTALIFSFLGRPNASLPGNGEGDKGLISVSNLIAMAVLCCLLLVGYWALMTFVPVPGIGKPDLSVSGRNLAHYLDQLYLPGKKFEGTILSTMAAVANCLLGVFAGLLLKSQRVGSQEKVYWLLGAGFLSLAVGFIWSQSFPIIKLLWTSSYVMVACGYSALLLAAFVQIIEIWNFRRWAQPFIWMGMNAITIYIIANVVSFQRLAGRFVGGNIHSLLNPYGDLIQALLGTLLCFWLVYFLYRKQIFLRL
jgi:predicted acyltransferase